MELGTLLALVVHNDLQVGELNIDKLVMHVVLHMVVQMEHSLMLVSAATQRQLVSRTDN